MCILIDCPGQNLFGLKLISSFNYFLIAMSKNGEYYEISKQEKYYIKSTEGPGQKEEELPREL